MNYHKLVILLIVVLILPFWVFADVTVTVTGTGKSYTQATNDALRNAVEQGAGVKIFSQTEVQDFVAIKDAIISESFGMVTRYKILSKRKTQGICEVKIKTDVTKDVEAKWAKIKMVLQQKGNPTVMFCIKETLDGKVTPQSTGEIRLNTKFRELGFQVIDRKDFEETKELHKKIQSLESDFNAIKAAASDRGADLLVTGMLEGNYKNTESVYGIEYINHNYIFGTKIINTGTSRVEGSLTQTYFRRHHGMVYSRDAAGRAGFADVIGDKYIQPMIVDLVSAWIKESASPITLIISNARYRLKKKVKSLLENGSENITSVDVKHYRNKRLKLRVMSQSNNEELAEILEEIPGLPLEVIEVKNSYVEARYLADKGFVTLKISIKNEFEQEDLKLQIKSDYDAEDLADILERLSDLSIKNVKVKGNSIQVDYSSK